MRFAAKVLACAVLAVSFLGAVPDEARGQPASPAITVRAIEVKGIAGSIVPRFFSTFG